MKKADRRQLQEILAFAYERIYSEDYQGTCSGPCKRYCPCLAEHNKYLKSIERGLSMLSDGWKRIPDSLPDFTKHGFHIKDKKVLILRADGKIERVLYQGWGIFDKGEDVSLPSNTNPITHWKPDGWEPLLDGPPTPGLPPTH